MDKQTTGNNPNLIDNTLCQSCTSFQSCLNHLSIPIDLNTNSHLLPSYIKLAKGKEPMLIKALLDSGSLGQDANYINQSIFNRLRLSNNIVIVNKKSETCNAILQACITSNTEIEILWQFYNNLTNRPESITMTCEVVNAPYDLIIGRESIKQHQLVPKCYRHFHIDLRQFRSLTGSGQGEEDGHYQIPVNFINLLWDGDKPHILPPQTAVAERDGYQEEGRRLKKSDLLSPLPSWEDNIDFISEELPPINDTIIDKTDQVSFEFTGEDSEFNAAAKILFKSYKDVISSSLRSTPAKVEPMKLVVDDSKWKVNANRNPPRMISREKDAAMYKQIETYLEQSVVESSVAPYWSQVLMTPKPT